MARLRILVVEDHADVTEMLCMLIERMGHDCRAVQTGTAALQLASTYKPDLILLDLGLPDITGYDVARALRAVGCTAKIVAVTGWGGPDDVIRSRAAGIDVHLIKPASAIKIAEVLRPLEEAADADDLTVVE